MLYMNVNISYTRYVRPEIQMHRDIRQLLEEHAQKIKRDNFEILRNIFYASLLAASFVLWYRSSDLPSPVAGLFGNASNLLKKGREKLKKILEVLKAKPPSDNASA